MLVLEKITMTSSEECIESNVISIETKTFLEEGTAIEALNNPPTIYNDNSKEQDLVS